MVSISFVALVELWNFASMLQELKQQELDLMRPHTDFSITWLSQVV